MSDFVDSAKKKANEFFNNLFLFIIVVFLGSLALLVLGFYSFEKDSFWQEVCSALATAGFTAVVFQLIAKSVSFYEVVEKAIKTTLNKTGQNELIESAIEKTLFKFSFNHNYLKSIHEDELIKLCLEINKFEHINIENNHKKQKSIKMAREYTEKKRNELLKKKKEEELTQLEELTLEWSNRNYFVEENIQTRTITKLGVEIISIEDSVVVDRDGDCIFNYRKTFNISNEKVLNSNFDDCKNGNRFCECSYSAKVIDYLKVDGEKRRIIPTIDVKKYIHEKTSGIEVVVKVPDCSKGERFKVLYSLTIPEEYTENKIKKMKEDENLLPHTNYLTNKAIRKIIIQEEIYNEDNQRTLKLDPAMKVYLNFEDRNKKELGKRIDPDKVNENLFYKQYTWTIYFEDYSHGAFVYTPF